MNIIKYFSLKEEIEKLEDKLLQMQQSVKDFGTICLLNDGRVDKELYEFENKLKKEFTNNYPFIKIRLVYHGHCLGCKTPLNKGCGTCRGCQFFEFKFTEGLTDLYNE